MREDAHSVDGTPGLDSLRRLHLMVLLRDLVDERGRMRAAEDLGISYRTLARCLESGRMTQTMEHALERMLLSRLRESTERTAERLTALEGRMEAAEERAAAAATSDDLQEAIEEAVDRRMEVLRRELQEEVIRGVQDASGSASGANDGSDVGTAPRSSRLHARPGVFSEEPVPGEAAAFGELMPLIEEWRDLAARRRRGFRSRLERVSVEERVLEVEIEMIEQRGLTPPPETEPLRGDALWRQSRWRKEALARVRREHGWLALLSRLLRALTLGMWRGAS